MNKPQGFWSKLLHGKQPEPVVAPKPVETPPLHRAQVKPAQSVRTPISDATREQMRVASAQRMAAAAQRAEDRKASRAARVEQTQRVTDAVLINQPWLDPSIYTDQSDRRSPTPEVSQPERHHTPAHHSTTDHTPSHHTPSHHSPSHDTSHHTPSHSVSHDHGSGGGVDFGGGGF